MWSKSSVNALGQLEDQMKERRYHEIVQSLAVSCTIICCKVSCPYSTFQAVKQIGASFRPYTSVQRISQLWRRIQEIQTELRSMIDADWDKLYASLSPLCIFFRSLHFSYMQDPAKPIKPSVVADACLVLDVLGADVRAQFVERYVALELKEYRRIFRATDEAGQLDNLSRRFAWFRRLLHTHETEQGRVFPAEWKAGWFLTAKFIEITRYVGRTSYTTRSPCQWCHNRDDMTALLSKAGSKLTVKQLLDTLAETMEFEASVTKKYSTPVIDAQSRYHYLR